MNPRPIDPATINTLRASTHDPERGPMPDDMVAITATVLGIRSDDHSQHDRPPIESYEIEHRLLGDPTACAIEYTDDTWRTIGPLSGPDYYKRPHDTFADALAWVVDFLDQLASTSANGAAFRSRLRREAARGNGPHDRFNLELLNGCRELVSQAIADQAFRDDPDAYRRGTTADYFDSLNPYKYTGDPTKAAGHTWQQLQLEIEQAQRDGKPDVAAAFQAERDRRDTENAERRAQLGMPPAEPGLRYVELPSDSHVFDAIDTRRARDTP